MRSFVRRLIVSASFSFGLGFVVAGCSEEPAGEPTFLRAQDLKRPEGGTDDPASLLTDEEFAFGDVQIEDFLKTLPPYAPSGASFLFTYQSNGRSFVQALSEISARYKVNPFLLLARLQMAQGLVSEQVYPYPPDRVEFVFGCGCRAPGECMPEYAGLDRQVECLAIQLSSSFAAAAEGGATASGWAIGQEHTTTDGREISPKNAATCAIYDEVPTVGGDRSGAQLWMNIYRLYLGESVVDEGLPSDDFGDDDIGGDDTGEGDDPLDDGVEP